MKKIAIIVFAAIFVITSCTKKTDKNPTQGPTKTCRLVKTVQGTGTDDTVYIYKYDSLGRIRAIEDSAYKIDLIKAVYNGTNKLPSKVFSITPDTLYLEYNGGGKVISSTYIGPALHKKFTYEYISDTLVSKIYEYTWDDNTNTWGTPDIETLIFDIMGNVAQTSTNSLGNITIRNITYTDKPNKLQDISYYDFLGLLYFSDIFPEGYNYYRPYLMNSYDAGVDSRSCTYTFDSLNNVTKSVVNMPGSIYVGAQKLTRKYFYDCK